MYDNFKNYRFVVIYIGEGNFKYEKTFKIFLSKDKNIAFVTGVTTIVNFLSPDTTIKSVTMYDC